MPHTIRNKKPLLTRVRRIQGQAASLGQALEKETECSAILQQIAAIRGAVNGLMTEVLEGHIREHLEPNTVSPKQRSEDLNLIVGILRSYLK